MSDPRERYDHNANNVTGTPVDEENDLVPIQLWREQQAEIERLRNELNGIWDAMREAHASYAEKPIAETIVNLAELARDRAAENERLRAENERLRADKYTVWATYPDC